MYYIKDESMEYLALLFFQAGIAHAAGRELDYGRIPREEAAMIRRTIARHDAEAFAALDQEDTNGTIAQAA